MTVASLACAPQHGAALTDDGRVLTWGAADGGRLGRRRKPGNADGLGGPPVSAQAHALPAAVPSLSDQGVVSLSAGGAHTVAATAKGELWLWGQVSLDKTYAVPVRAMGEHMGGAHFLRAWSTEWSTFAVAIPPQTEEEY